MTAMGAVGVLNVGAGDVKLTFDKAKPVEREHAAKVVTEMLERGYAILIQVGEEEGEPVYRRAKGFDPETCEYLIVGVGDDRPVVPALPSSQPDAGTDVAVPGTRRRGRPRTHRVPAESTRAVAVHRSAGG